MARFSFISEVFQFMMIVQDAGVAKSILKRFMPTFQLSDSRYACVLSFWCCPC